MTSKCKKKRGIIKPFAPAILEDLQTNTLNLTRMNIIYTCKAKHDYILLKILIIFN